MVKSAQTKCVFDQKGIIDPKIIIGGIIVLVIIFFLATGSFKFSTSVKPATNQTSTSSSSETKQDTKEAPKPESKPKTYQSEKYGYSLEYPSSWSLKENPIPTFATGFFSPEDSSSDNYKENLLVKIVDLSTQPKITLQEAADLWENQTKKAEENNFNVIERKSSTLAGEDAKDIIFDIKDKELDGKGMIRIILKNKKAYIFQYNALKSAYDKYLSDIETILASIKF